MAYLTAAVVLVGALGVVNLLFTFGVIRRLREQFPDRPDSASAPAVGTVVDVVASVTTEGEAVTLGRAGVVGFFSPGCGPCTEQLPKFLEFSRGLDRSFVTAVVVGPDSETETMALALGEVAHVVAEGPDGPLQRAFGVTGYPTFLLMGADRTVLASGNQVADLPAEARV